MSEGKIVIVGAGIGGLVLTLALQRVGIEVEVYEAAESLDEVGAGVALWSNATRLLHGLGLEEELAEFGSEPTQLIIRDGVDGTDIIRHELTENNWYRNEFGAPYYGIHRRSFQKILADRVKPGTINLGHRLVGIERVDAGVTRLRWANGSSTDAGLVVGADGIRSVVRSWMYDGLDYTMFSKTSGFRGVVPLADLKELPDPTATQFWVGDGKHFLHFPIGPDYTHATFLAVVEDPKIWTNPSGSRVSCTPQDAVAPFLDWHPAIAEMINAAAPDERWGLFGVGPMPTWVKDNVVLLGDAAHGLLPHHGQGANQCVEDAIILADLLAEPSEASQAQRLQRYCDLRMDRAQRVQKISWVSNRLFHLPAGPEIPVRDATFKNLYNNVRWIHEYDASTAVALPTTV
ncbi:FAD-dependent oxidoreductase [Mycobacterium sp. MS1601]|uniref:FAD-dependent oxidoreductase n=1 Tax=Mycobacterium sp. MS1601 TaxID=1936029 RepID=UPI00178C92B5|nr:FAD-dependent monooxygenase [Mycobacterium sp. MS1601]